MPSTDTAIKNAKPGPTTKKLSDGSGLQLWVKPNGAKLWCLAYRDQAGKQQKLSFGPYPDLSLADARAKRGEAKRLIVEITPPEVLKVLQTVEATGRLETARRMRSSIGEVFRFAIATGRATNDPTFALSGALTAPQSKHRAALTDAKAFGELLRAIEGFQGQPTTQAALKLFAYLFPRPGELRMAEWSEFDLAKAIWTVPAKRMKMRREHRVPLPKQAMAILEGIQPLTAYSAFVFPAVSNPKRPMSENTLNAALRRMGGEIVLFDRRVKG